MPIWIWYALSLGANLGFVIIGFIASYKKTEARNEERHKHITEQLKNHEKRLQR